MQKIHTIILARRGFVKVFLHIFSFVSATDRIFCISVKTHEGVKAFLVKIAYENTHTRKKARPSRYGQRWGVKELAEGEITPRPDGKTSR